MLLSRNLFLFKDAIYLYLTPKFPSTPPSSLQVTIRTFSFHLTLQLRICKETSRCKIYWVKVGFRRGRALQIGAVVNQWLEGRRFGLGGGVVCGVIGRGIVSGKKRYEGVGWGEMGNTHKRLMGFLKLREIERIWILTSHRTQYYRYTT